MLPDPTLATPTGAAAPAALGELVDGLALARCLQQALPARRDLLVAAVELEGGIPAAALGALDPGLRGEHVGAGRAADHGGEADAACGLRTLGGFDQHGLAAH